MLHESVLLKGRKEKEIEQCQKDRKRSTFIKGMIFYKAIKNLDRILRRRTELSIQSREVIYFFLMFDILSHITSVCDPKIMY